ncbi:uncharacterized protein PRCAT00003045001 [Priceomyces carsonii]|uniref:uncharacterized protein n=1 Tax=Priceomyces carsonii TaxID=28549 RepID=UPI002EDA00BB|nr:unnamed protein product [Priceomyces carsonii]
MSSFSRATFKSLNYNSFRPQYQPSFYHLISQYVCKNDTSKLPIDVAIDLGCGTGIASFPLLNFTNKVIGLDLSPKMIETANSLIKERCDSMKIQDYNRIGFLTGSVEDFLYQQNGDRLISENSVDLISAAQCIHWFKDYKSFFQNCYTLLKPGGTLGYWYYIDPVILDFRGPSKDISKEEATKTASEIYFKYVYDDPAFLGSHWEQPGRSVLKDHLKEVNKCIPYDLYDNVTIRNFAYDPKKSPQPTLEDLDLSRYNIQLSDYVDYLRTYSSFSTFKAATGDKEDIYGQLLKDFEHRLGWTNETKIDLVWNTGYTLLTKKYR